MFPTISLFTEINRHVLMIVMILVFTVQFVSSNSWSFAVASSLKTPCWIYSWVVPGRDNKTYILKFIFF